MNQGSVYASSGGNLRNLIRSAANLSQIPVEKASNSNSSNMYPKRMVRHLGSQVVNDDG